MTKFDWKVTLTEAELDVVKELLAPIEEVYTIEIIKPPQNSLVMVKGRDSVKGQPFYSGEALLTECIVKLDDSYGFGAVLGDEIERAYYLAVIDLALQMKLPEIET